MNIVFSLLFTDENILPEQSDSYITICTDTGKVLTPVLVIPGTDAETMSTILKENVDNFLDTVTKKINKKLSGGI